MGDVARQLDPDAAWSFARLDMLPALGDMAARWPDLPEVQGAPGRRYTADGLTRPAPYSLRTAWQGCAVTPGTACRANGRRLPASGRSDPDGAARRERHAKLGAMTGLDHALTDGVVTLRAFDPSDRLALVGGRDKEARRFLGDDGPEPTPVACICVDQMIVGWIDYDHDRHWLKENEVNVGYNVFPEHRGRGYGTLALRLLCRYLGAQDPPLRPTLLIDPDNGPSLALAISAGFANVDDVDGQHLFRPFPGRS